jgi:hypothetical protein
MMVPGGDAEGSQDTIERNSVKLTDIKWVAE